MAEGIVEFNEWLKLDLRVGKILEVEKIIGADKLYKLLVDIGLEKITLVAGLRPYYKESELLDKRCIVFTNLKPRVVKGIESKGMLLAAVNKNESKVVLISPENEISIGSKIR